MRGLTEIGSSEKSKLPAEEVDLIQSELVRQRRPSPGVKFHRGEDLHPVPRGLRPDPVNLSSVREWVLSAVTPTAVDLFCGAGGLSLGLNDAGFTVLVGADSDERAVETHTANLGGLGYVGDLTDPEDFLAHLRAWRIDHVDLVAGGVPCQPFSRAGRSKIRSLVETSQRSADDPRAQLWKSFIKVVHVLQPRAVLLENVPDLAVWDDGAVLVGLMESLTDLGYQPQARVVNAFDHGVPQHRSRLFIVALRPDLAFEWPEPAGSAPSVRDAIGDLPSVPPAQREDRIRYSKPTSSLQIRLRKGVDQSELGWVFDHITRDVREDDAEAFSLMEEGGTYEDLPERLQRYRSDIFTDKYKRLSWDGLSRSITAHIAKDGYWYIHPSDNRTLSIREAARIQTFPDWFRFAGQQSHRFRQIGNAVPPILGEAIGNQVMEALSGKQIGGAIDLGGERQTFRTQLMAWHHENSRHFSWRDRSDPWHVLVAEMCLHRTRADQVERVYRSLMEIGPTPAAMVANEQVALAAMSSLGLNWRASNLLAVARALIAENQGAVPSSDAGLRSLPGVGDYVASAVRSFGFGVKTALVDTNTERIVIRVLGRQKPRRWQLRLDLFHLSGREGPDSAFNYALLDLGGLVCRPREPVCESCPVNDHCLFANSNEKASQPTDVRLPL